MLEKMPAKNVTVRAQWNITTEYFEAVFKEKGLGEEEAKEVIKKYVSDGGEFVIEKFDADKSTSEVTVIVKFTDREVANVFFRVFHESKGPATPLGSSGLFQVMSPSHPSFVQWHCFSPFYFD